MEIQTNNNYVKIGLPNGRVVDVLSPVLDVIKKWIQDDNSKPESGGFIVGYQHKETGNVSLEEVSHPYLFDECNRVRFNIRDPRHQLFLRKARQNKSYYMGVWHTHPQNIPVPSEVDWKDWRETLKIDQTGCQYVFFAIAGTDEWRLWIGDFITGKIQEIYECQKGTDGIYFSNY